MAFSLLVKHELRLLWREPGTKVLMGVMLLLLLISTWSGTVYFTEKQQQHEEATTMARALWEQQGDKNPHSAAHYGTHAFLPVTLLAVFDPGTQPFTGVSLFLEAHRQNFAVHSPVEDRSSLSRFGQLTPAFIFTFLFPLFIIFLGYRSVIAERENGMLRLLLSQGVRMKHILTGKAAALWILVSGFFLLFALVGLFVLVTTGSEGYYFLRYALMMAGWLLYFGIFIHLSVWVSAKAGSQAQALVLLLGFWVLSTLFVPRLIAATADQVHPVPDTVTFQQAVQRHLSEGIDGHNPLSEHTRAFQDSVLAAHGVTNPADLPFNLGGLMLQVSEEFEKEVFDYHMARISLIHEQQLNLFKLSAVVSPAALVRLFSMGMAGTDMAAFNHFRDQAEAFRIELMRELNEDLMIHAVGDRAQGYTAGVELFSQNITFEYEPPRAVEWITKYLTHGLLLLLWSGLSFGLLLTASRKTEV